MTGAKAPTATTAAWFEKQVAVVPAHHDLMLGGRSVHFRSWGSPGRAQIVLVHGGAANSAWWDHIAPGLVEFGHVHAIDLGGHGRSDWAPEYTLEGWAHEVVALVEHLDTAGDPVVLIGHSRGGFVALLASMEARANVAGLVLIESAFDVDPPPAPPARSRSASAADAARTREHMVARFRPYPGDAPSQDYVVAHIAEQSVVESHGQWRWQFDPSFLGRVKAMRLAHLRPTTTEVLQIRGSQGLLTATAADAARRALRPDSEIIVIDGAGHHIMLQKPRELVSYLRSTIASWLQAPDAAAARSSSLADPPS